MSQAKFTTEEYLAAYELHGSIDKAGKALGVSRQAIYRAIVKTRNDPAISAAMKRINTSIVPNLTWVKTKHEDGTAYSVLLKPEQISFDSLVENLEEIFSNVPPAPQIPEPSSCNSDLLTVYKIADLHIGMRSWKDETGNDYDTTIAVDLGTKGMSECISGSPASETCIILNLGDMTHADNNQNQTPKSKHALDVDGRHFKTLESSVLFLIHTIEMALQKHKYVIVRNQRGNHDEISFMAITLALYQRYHSCDRVTIDKSPNEFFVYEFGKNMIAACHGDKGDHRRLVLFFSDEYAQIWGKTRWRYLYTGHVHKSKGEDIGGMYCESLRAAALRDAYAHSNGYTGRSQIRATTFHIEHGERSRYVVNY